MSSGPRILPQPSPKFRRRRDYRRGSFWRRDRDADIEAGKEARTGSAASSYPWISAALWLLIIVPAVVWFCSSLFLINHWDRNWLWALRGGSAVTAFLGAPLVAWMLLVRQFRITQSPRPFSDMIAVPLAAWTIAGSALVLGALLQSVDGLWGVWEIVRLPLLITPIGAAWGALYWFLAGRPRPPYD